MSSCTTFNVFAVRHEHRAKSVAERVPADMLLNSRTQRSRPEDAGDEDIWPIRVLAVGMWASEQPIMRLSVWAVLLPGPELRRENGIHGYWFSRGFRLAVANDIPVDRPLHVDMEIVEINIFPL